MPRIVTNLWFDTEALEAAEHYISIFPDSRVRMVSRYPEDAHRPAGMVMVVDFVLDGQPFAAINGGPGFPFTEAVSLLVECADQDEVDYYWAALGAGGREGPCGWLQDRYGLSWQVVPAGMDELFADPDAARVGRAMHAMYGMGKLDLPALLRAADGE